MPRRRRRTDRLGGLSELPSGRNSRPELAFGDLRIRGRFRAVGTATADESGETRVPVGGWRSAAVAGSGCPRWSAGGGRWAAVGGWRWAGVVGRGWRWAGAVGRRWRSAGAGRRGGGRQVAVGGGGRRSAVGGRRVAAPPVVCPHDTHPVGHNRVRGRTQHDSSYQARRPPTRAAARRRWDGCGWFRAVPASTRPNAGPRPPSTRQPSTEHEGQHQHDGRGTGHHDPGVERVRPVVQLDGVPPGRDLRLEHDPVETDQRQRLPVDRCVPARDIGEPQPEDLRA